MTNWHSINRQGLLFITLLQCLLFASAAHAANDELSKQIKSLDDRYQKLVSQYYRSSAEGSQPIVDVDQLYAQVISTSERQHPLPAIRLLAANLETLEAAPDHPTIPKLVDFLLQQNQWRLVNRVKSLVDASGDSTNLAYLDYHQARYQARLNQWELVHSLIKDTFSELSSEDSDYAYLLQGSALQYLEQHRASTESYANIPATSQLYIHAQFNTAIASIRQGWLTEARLTIKQIIPAAPASEAGMINRIYLMLGYALLHKEYYRDARDAFRKVKLDSRYANKALLGIALTAISQGDYVGGLNALEILKNRQSTDLSADEAYLLIPHIYVALQQLDRVADSFLESIDFYQQKLLTLNNLKHLKPRFEEYVLEPDSGDIIFHGRHFPLSRDYPFYLLGNRNDLHYLKRNGTTENLSRQVNQLLIEHDKMLKLVFEDMIETRGKIFTSYINQSRYGLARHYDESQQGAE